MEFNTLAKQDMGGLGCGAGGVGRDGGNDPQGFQLLVQPMRQNSALEYAVRGSGSGRGRGRGRGRLLPPPFLSKMYQIVDDPNTNSLISWSPNNKSFIIFDQIDFATQILPKYFKHSNFSSFIYQLNNYGFRKISWDKLEYENPWFQSGKEHWLQNITRRDQRLEPETLASLAPSDDFDNVRREMELETLSTEQSRLQVEIKNLRQQQEELENQFKSFEESTIFTDSKHEEMVIPLLAQQFIQCLKEKREMDSKESSKKQKLDPSESTDISKNGTDEEEKIHRQNVDGKDQFQEELNEMQPDGEIISSPDDSGSSNKKEKDGSTSGTDEDMAFWKKMLEDDSENENEAQEKLPEPHLKIIIRLEDLMAANSPTEGENLVPKSLNDKVEEDDHLKLLT